MYVGVSIDFDIVAGVEISFLEHKVRACVSVVGGIYAVNLDLRGCLVNVCPVIGFIVVVIYRAVVNKPDSINNAVTVGVILTEIYL